MNGAVVVVVVVEADFAVDARRKYMNNPGLIPKLLLACWLLGSVCASGADIFARGSISRNSIDTDKWKISVSAIGGLAFKVSEQIRIEARYTNISSLQNKLDITSGGTVGTLTDILTETEIYSLGVDIELTGKNSRFKPFIYLGAGYVITKQTYDFTPAGSSVSTPFAEAEQKGVSGNLGLGVRWQIAKRLAIELEGFAYGTDFDKPQPLFNIYASAGLRFIL
ncbi:MAG: autotransporter domain-containing protein [Bdellovibrionales bacterium]|nr:autotransporter domain-containing protein [Bdellovibrionales bacterium]